MSTLQKWIADSEPRFIVILGEFGTGKTFLLRELARRMGETLNTESAHTALLPLLLEMRQLEKTNDLDKLVAQQLAKEAGYDAKKFRYMLAQGKIVLLFDGFDELALRVSYDRVLEHFGTLLDAAQGDYAKVIVTSRKEHFKNEKQIKLKLLEAVERVRGQEIVYLQKFDDEQVFKFLVKKLESEQKAQDFYILLNDIKDLMGLSENPRMLSFIVELPEADLRQAQQQDGEITAAKVYEMILTRWLEGEQKRVKTGYHDDLKVEQRWQAVEKLALHLWGRTAKTVDILELDGITKQIHHELDLLLEHGITQQQICSGTLLVRDKEGQFGFIHQSVMEWLIAKAAAAILYADKKCQKIIPLLSQRIISPLMARFFIDLVGKEIAQKWAQSIIKQVRATPENQQNADLILKILGDTQRKRLNRNGQNLRGQDFSEQNLCYADFSDADLTDALFKNAILQHANFSNAILKNANFTKADLSYANFTNAICDEVSLLGAIVHQVNFSAKSWRRVDFSGWDLSHTDFTASDLTACQFRATTLQYANFTRATLKNADLSYANFTDAICDEVSLLGAIVHQVNFSAKSWRRVDFSGWDLSHADFTASDLTACQFRATTLQHANFTRATLKNADFTKADLSHANFTDAICDEVSLLGATVHQVNFSAKSWRRAKLLFTNPPELPPLQHALGAVLSHSEKPALIFPRDGYCYSFCFSPDDRLIAVAVNNVIQVWTADSGQCLRILTGHIDYVRSVAWGEDGAQVFSGSSDKSVRVWDVDTGQCLCILEGHTREVRSVARRRDGVQVLSGSSDNSVRVWDVDTEQCLNILEGHKREVTSVAWRGDGVQVLSGSYDKSVRVWDIGSGQCLRILTGHTDWVVSVAWRGNGAQALSGSYDNSVRVWDVGTGQCLCILEGHTSYVTSVAWRKDGAQVLSGSEDNSVRVWDVDSGQCLRILAGHTKSVTSVAWRNDDKQIVSSSADGTIRLWDAETGECLAVFIGWHEGWASYSPKTGRYNYGGNVQGKFWYAVGLCRLELNELDKVMPELRVKAGESLF